MPQGRWPAHVGLSLLCGLTFILAHDIVSGFGWAPAAALGSVAVAVALAVVARLSGRRLSMPTHAGRLVILGAAVTVQNLGVCLALDRLGLALTAIGGMAETQEMMDFCAEHGIVADIELVRAERREGVSEPRSYGDYTVTVDEARIPDGVTCTRLG